MSPTPAPTVEHTRSEAIPTPLPIAEVSPPPARPSAPALTPVPRPRLAPVPIASGEGGVEAMATDVLASHGIAPLVVTVERGSGQSTASLLFPPGTPVDLFTLSRVARAHGAVVASVAWTEQGSKAVLLLERPAPAAPDGAQPGASLLARVRAAYAAWRSAR